jgi:hypothetical protein
LATKNPLSILCLFLPALAVPPMMWIPAQQVSVMAGAELKLVCFVESHPEALTFWEHNGRMLQPNQRISIRNQIGTPRYKASPTFLSTFR